MGSDSRLGKLRKILTGPEAPAHVHLDDGTMPWYRRLWQAIRPPSAVPSKRVPMSKTQRRMLLITASVVIPAGIAWGIVDYLANAPQRARASFEAGMQLLGPNDFTGAVAKFSDSIATSETAVAYMQRGNAYQNLGKADEALADWGRAINLDGGLAAAYTARATHYRLVGEFDKALPDLDQSVQLDPSVDGYFQRGQVYAALGQYEKALEDYDRSISERRESPYVYFARSVAKRALGDEEGYHQDQATGRALLGER